MQKQLKDIPKELIDLLPPELLGEKDGGANSGGPSKDHDVLPPGAQKGKN